MMRWMHVGQGTDRVAALSDAVFSIAITLLVLGIEVPSVPPAAMLDARTRVLLHELEVYVASFVVIGFFWYMHHAMFKLIRRHDAVLLVLNLVSLLPITLIPFHADFIAEYPRTRLTVVALLGTLLLASLLQLALWAYAARRRRLIDGDLPERAIRAVAYRLLAPAVLFGLGIGLAFVDVDVARRTYLALVVFWVGLLAEGGARVERGASRAR